MVCRCAYLAAGFLALILTVQELAQPADATAAATALDKYFTNFSPTLVSRFSNGTISLSKLQYDSAAVRTKSRFLFGAFSFRVKLPAGFSAGIVSAIYLTSSGHEDKAWRTRDEVDLEFLGHTESKKIILATNYYAQGRGQGVHEEGFKLWFDPAERFHTYTIWWGRNHIQWSVDGIPLRETTRRVRNGRISYPNKPMYLQMSMWDASQWATDGGRIKADYSHQPFKFYISDINFRNVCRYKSKRRTPKCVYDRQWSRGLSSTQRTKMYQMRRRYMLWSNVK